MTILGSNSFSNAELGKHVQKIRQNFGLSINLLARRAKLNPADLVEKEKGVQPFTALELGAIASALSLNVNVLYGVMSNASEGEVNRLMTAFDSVSLSVNREAIIDYTERLADYDSLQMDMERH